MCQNIFLWDYKSKTCISAHVNKLLTKTLFRDFCKYTGGIWNKQYLIIFVFRFLNWKYFSYGISEWHLKFTNEVIFFSSYCFRFISNSLSKENNCFVKPKTTMINCFHFGYVNYFIVISAYTFILYVK